MAWPRATRIANAEIADTITLAAWDAVRRHRCHQGIGGRGRPGSGRRQRPTILFAGRGATTLLGGGRQRPVGGGAGADVLNAAPAATCGWAMAAMTCFSGEDDFTVIGFRAGAGTDTASTSRVVAGIDDSATSWPHSVSAVSAPYSTSANDEITGSVSASQLLPRLQI